MVGTGGLAGFGGGVWRGWSPVLPWVLLGRWLCPCILVLGCCVVPPPQGSRADLGIPARRTGGLAMQPRCSLSLRASWPLPVPLPGPGCGLGQEARRCSHLARCSPQLRLLLALLGLLWTSVRGLAQLLALPPWCQLPVLNVPMCSRRDRFSLRKGLLPSWRGPRRGEEAAEGAEGPGPPSQRSAWRMWMGCPQASGPGWRSVRRRPVGGGGGPLACGGGSRHERPGCLF